MKKLDFKQANKDGQEEEKKEMSSRQEFDRQEIQA